MEIIRFIKNWTLPIAMLSGVAGYFIYVNIPFLEPTRLWVNSAVHFIQPALVFTRKQDRNKINNLSDSPLFTFHLVSSLALGRIQSAHFYNIKFQRVIDRQLRESPHFTEALLDEHYRLSTH